jgi:serine/threonine-protein kinase HipA
MSLLTARDGDSGKFDYLDLAEAVEQNGDATITADLAELWRRIAFSVAVHNTDDHLRNHGFLRGRAGWRLSPLFDVNPEPDVAKQRQLGIASAHARADEIDGLRAAAASFGLDHRQAGQVLEEVFEATTAWRQVAVGNGIPERELNRMSDAFDGLRPTVA